MIKDLAIDIGGTKIHIAIVSKDLNIVDSYKISTDEIFDNTPVDPFNELFSIIKKLFGTNFRKIGISLKGQVQNNIIIESSLIPRKTNIDIEKIAAGYFKFNFFTCENDVICMAKAEQHIGMGKVCTNFSYINLGTGLRIVNIDNSHILKGKLNLAGEVSSLKFWSEDLRKVLKFSDILSGKGIVKMSYSILGKHLHAEDIFIEGHKPVVLVFISALSQLIHQIDNFYNPEMIVIGGSFIKSADMWLDEVRKQVKSNDKYHASDIVLTTLDYPATIGALVD